MQLGEVWEDTKHGHRVGCLDSTDPEHVALLMNGRKARLAIHDPPYNQITFKKLPVEEYVKWCELWIDNTLSILDDDSSLYIWTGADQFDSFQPLPDLMLMLRTKPIRSRSFSSLTLN